MMVILDSPRYHKLVDICLSENLKLVKFTEINQNKVCLDNAKLCHKNSIFDVIYFENQ